MMHGWLQHACTNHKINFVSTELTSQYNETIGSIWGDFFLALYGGHLAPAWFYFAFILAACLSVSEQSQYCVYLIGQYWPIQLSCVI